MFLRVLGVSVLFASVAGFGLSLRQDVGRTITAAEGDGIRGSGCADYSLDPYGGCNPSGFNGLKFWETCPQSGTLTGGLTYRVAAASYTCSTTCGYHCGTYLSGYTPCAFLEETGVVIP